MEQSQKVNQRFSGTTSLWPLVLVPPIAWAVQMETNYALVPFECYGGSRLPLYAVMAVAFALVFINAMVAAKFWSQLGKKWPDDGASPASRDRFLSVLGLLVSGMFTLVLIAQTIAIIVFHPCAS